MVKLRLDLGCHAPTIFQLFSTKVSETKQEKKFLRISEIADEGFMVNQHSKRISKPKFEFQPHLALQQDYFRKKQFILQDCWAHYL